MARLHTYADIWHFTQKPARILGVEGFEERTGISWTNKGTEAKQDDQRQQEALGQPRNILDHGQRQEPIIMSPARQPDQSLHDLQQRLDKISGIRLDTTPTLPKDKIDHIHEMCGCTLSNKVRALSVGRNERMVRSSVQEKTNYANAIEGLQAILREPCFIDPQKSINELLRNELQNPQSPFVRKLMGAECQALNIQDALKRVKSHPQPSADGTFGDYERIATAFIQYKTGKTVDGAFGADTQAGLRHMAEKNLMCGEHTTERAEVGLCGPEVQDAVKRPLLSALADWHTGEFARMNMNTIEIGKSVPVTLTLREVHDGIQNGKIDPGIANRAKGERVDLTGPNMTAVLKFATSRDLALFQQAAHEGSKNAPSAGDVHGHDTEESDALHAKESRENMSKLVQDVIAGHPITIEGKQYDIRAKVLPDFERHDFKQIPEVSYRAALRQAVEVAKAGPTPAGMTKQEYLRQIQMFDIQMKNPSTRPTVEIMPLLRQVDHGEMQPDWVQQHALDPILGKHNAVDQVLNVQSNILGGVATFAKEMFYAFVDPSQTQWGARSKYAGETMKYDNYVSDPTETHTLTSHGMETMPKDPTMQRKDMKITLRDDKGNPVLETINFADKGIAAGMMPCGSCDHLPRGTVLHVDVDMATGRTKDGGFNTEKLGETAKHLLDFSVVKPADMTKEDFDQLTQNGTLPKTLPDGKTPMTLDYVRRNAQVLCNQGVVHPLTFVERGDPAIGSLILGTTLYFALKPTGGGSTAPCPTPSAGAIQGGGPG